MQRAVFLDRDGTLIKNVAYINDPAHVEVFPDVVESLTRLKQAGYRIVIITNQSGFDRGLVTPEQYEAVHARLVELAGAGLIDATYMCPDFGPRRKPSPGMIFEAARDLGIDPKRSVMIGDKASDIHCGRNAGTKTIFIRTGYEMNEPCDPDYTAATMKDAAEWILQTQL
ncbi:MAG TPA: HAD family hydrolase [Chthoniobacteraceae bacterium]|jgi:histidinol-phosphate phosphatase family protein|nr:HAD family hydrolase [Chthoniobacteraceae bacterium]